VAKQFIDRWLTKFISRKLIVWISSTSFLCLGFITGDQWVAVSLAYIGVQGLADIATRWKAAKPSTPQA